MNKTKYKIIIAIITVINIVLMYFFISLDCVQAKSEESFNFSMEESILKEPNKLYIVNGKTNENEEEKINNNYQTGEEKYYIKVNCLAQTVTIYEKDEKGYYSIPIKAMICSTGTNTPQTGIYQITYYKKEWLALQGKVYGQYCTQIVGNILFHSVPYLEYENPASLEYWEYDKLGQEASLGCVRLIVKDAKWIFDNCDEGTKVEFYSSENPGPLGKPTIEKISKYENFRNWDPTDEEEENPWKQYFEEKKKEIKKIKQVVTTISEITKYMKVS